MIKPINTLTWSVFTSYGNRKKQGRVAIFVDTRDNKIYPVPRDEEHVDFINRIISEKTYSKIIPSYVDIQIIDGIEKVVAVETGYSGVEIKLGIRHTSEDLEKAHSLVHDFVNQGEIPLIENIESKLTYKFAIKRKPLNKKHITARISN